MSVTVGFSGVPPLWVSYGGSVDVQVSTTAPGNIVATVPPGACAQPEVASLAGPTAVFTFDGLVAGSVTATFTDSLGATGTLVIGVAGPLVLSNETPGSGAQPYAILQAIDPGFFGPLTPVCVPPTAGLIQGPGQVIYGEAGAGPSQDGPGPVEWVVTPLLGNTTVSVEVFDLAGNSKTIALPFVASSPIGAYDITFLDYLGLSGVAAGFAWVITYAGLPPSSPIPPVDSGWTLPGGIVRTAVLLANTYYTITFEGNGAPPAPVTFLSGAVGDGSLSWVIGDYSPPGRGISEAGYAAEAVHKLPAGWFDESELVPGGEAYAVTYAGIGPTALMDSLTEGLKTAQRVQTADGADLDSFLADFFGEACPLPRLLGGETDASYRAMGLVMLPAPSSTIPNLQTVVQAHLDRYANGAVALVFDWTTNPGGMTALGYPDALSSSGVFGVLAYWPSTVGADTAFADFSFADYSYAGLAPQSGFYLDYNYMDWDAMLPPEGVVAPMPPWDPQLAAIVKARKTAGRKIAWAMAFFQ